MSKWVEQETKRAQKSNLYQSTIKYCTQRDCFGFDSAILNFVFSCLFVTSRAKVEMDIAEDRDGRTYYTSLHYPSKPCFRIKQFRPCYVRETMCLKSWNAVLPQTDPETISID